MRLCLVTPEFPPHLGGIARSVLRIATGLALHTGHEVHVVAFDDLWSPTDPGAATPTGQITSVSEGQLLVHRVHGFSRNRGPAAAFAYAWLDRLLGQYAFDALAAFNLQMAFPVTLLGREREIPTVASSRGPDSMQQVWNPPPFAQIQWVLASADRVHAMNSASLRRMNAISPLGQRGCVIPSAVDPSAFRPGVAAIDLPSNAVVVATAANFRPFKRLDVALEAVARLQRSDVALLVIGDDHPSAAPEVRPAVARYSDRIPISVTGRVPTEAVLQYLRAADIFVLSSDFEGGPNVLAEAMLAARPIVTTTVGMAPDVLRDGEDALLVPTNDPDAMGRALQTLIDDPERARRMGESVYRVATRDLSPRREAEAWDAMLQALSRDVKTE